MKPNSKSPSEQFAGPTTKSEIIDEFWLEFVDTVIVSAEKNQMPVGAHLFEEGRFWAWYVNIKISPRHKAEVVHAAGS